jgi:hypothetical protein
LRQRGLFSDKETANEIIAALVEDCSAPELRVAINQLPAELRPILLGRLMALRDIDFNWFPSSVGPGLSEVQQREFKVELKNRFANFEALFD